jgi:uncharacterized protein YjbJ (UPF0337 family)
VAQTAEELRLELRDKRAAVSRDLEEIGDKVSPKRTIDRAGSKVKQKVTGVKDKVMGSAENVAGSASDVAGTAGEKVGNVKDRVAGAPEALRQTTEGNPLAVGLIAFGAGLLAASLIPATRRERELMGQVEEPLQKAAEVVGDAAATVKDELQGEAQNVVADLRDSAQQHVQNVKEEASSAATDVAEGAKEQAQDAVQQVKQGDDADQTQPQYPPTVQEPVAYTATTPPAGYPSPMGAETPGRGPDPFPGS